MSSMFNTSLTLCTRAALAAFLAGAALPAAAAPAETNTATTEVRLVHIGDLDLASAAGQAELRHRVIHASREVCRVVTGDQSPGEPDFRDCEREAFSQAWHEAEAKIAAAKGAALVASIGK